MGTPEQQIRNPATMESRIFITHYVNPHHFWYKPFHPGSKKKQQKQLQDEIDEYCEQHYMDVSIGHYEPVFGEVVAFYDPSIARWTRCSVDGLKLDGKGTQRFRLWSIDEGCPKVVCIEQLRPLPGHFHDRSTSTVKRGAIKNIFPAQCVFDPQEEQLRLMECSVWAETANIMLRSFIEGNQQICFTSVTPYTAGNESINFGDLLFVTKSKTYNAANLLAENAMGLVVESKNFIIQMLEMDAMFSSRASSMVSGGVLQGTGDTPMAPVAKQRNEAIAQLNGVSEREFDESVSMVGMVEKNVQSAAVLPPPQQLPVSTGADGSSTTQTPNTVEGEKHSQSSGSKKSVGLAQKLKLLKTQRKKNETLNSSQERSSSCTEMGSLASGQYSVDPFEQIRKDAYALTIDVGLTEKAEYELLKGTMSPEPNIGRVPKAQNKEEDTKLQEKENKPTKDEKTKDVAMQVVELKKTPVNVPLPEAKPTKVAEPRGAPTKAVPPKDIPTSTVGQTSDSSGMTTGGSSLKQRLMNKIANAKALQNKQKQSDGEQNAATPVVSFAPAGIQNNLLVQQCLELPTVQSNAELKKFEKVIQGEKCIFSRRSHHRVLVHGSKTPKPIDRIAAANFSPRVHQELEQLGFTTLHRLQAYSWPHILRGNSFICVNGASTGKTFAYLPAVCSVVQRQIEESLVCSLAGPVAIIVTYTSREVQRIAFFCRKLLHSEAHTELAVLECYGIRDVTKACNLLFNGCAILVTTAPGYRRLYERAPEALVRKRIQMVVIDNLEEILPYFGQELQLLCKNCDKEGLQMIVTAGYWVPMLAKFLQRYRNMIICIGAFLEAAVYAKAHFCILSFVGEERKQVELIAYLKKHDYRSERTIVFGNDSDDLVPIVNALRQNSINHMVGSERMVLQQHAGFSNWDELQPGDMVVLVCSDTVLGDLKISQAQHIIHYSLATTWSSFTRRYACSFGYYECPYLPSKGKEAKGSASSLVLLNEKNNQQLPRLVDFLELHQEPVPGGLFVHAQKIRCFLESARVANGRAVSLLCTYILGFAVCRNARNCVFRHTLTLDDMAPETVPRSGKVRMKICHVFSPAHFAVRLEQHRAPGATDWTVLNDTERYLLQDIAIQVHFSNETRHQMHGQPQRNDLCVVFDDQKYWRCQIINYEEMNVDNGEVQLLAIDTGRILHKKSFSLLHLPDQFRELPAQAINVRIAAVVPHDYEQDWDKSATNTVRHWIENYATRPNCSIQGNVLLALKGTVWVDELYLVEELDGVKTTVTVERVRASLVAKQFGVGDSASFERIRQLVWDCETYGMESLRRELENMERSGKGANGGDTGGMDSVDDDVLKAAVVKPSEEVSFDSIGTLKMVHIEVPIKDDYYGIKVSEDEEEKENESIDMDNEPVTKVSKEQNEKEKEKIGLKESAMVVDKTDNVQQQLPTASQQHDSDEKLNKIPEHGMIPASEQNMPEHEMTPVLEEIFIEETEKDPNKLVPIETMDSTMSSSSSFELLSPSEEVDTYQFDSLLVGNSYSVMIGHYLAPDNFYISQSNRICEVDAVIKEFTKDSSTLVPLKHPRTGQHCLVLFENFYHRGRIVNVLENAEVDVFLVDFGGTVRCSEIFKATEKLLRSVPFLAIKGSFAYILPPGGATEWSDEIADAIYDRWLEQHNRGTMFAIIEKVLSWQGAERIEGCHRYEMLLCDSNSQDMFSIVSDIVYDRLAIWVRNEDSTSTVADTDDDDNFTQVNFTHEELMDLMQKASSAPRNGVAPARAIKDSDDSRTVPEELPMEKKDAPAGLLLPASQETSDDEKVAKRAVRKQKRTLKELPLECDYRFPPTVWDQDQYFVVLRVHAPDVKRYNLTLSHTCLLLQFLKEDEDERYVLGLTLRNPIVPSDSVHGIRGLSIVVRLRKLIPGMRWPTVDTLGSKKLRWVQFGGDGESSSDEMVKENRWKDLLRAHLDSSSVDSLGSGNEQTLQEDSDAQDEEGVFLALN
uniref:RNA helicase n=1 Tax=Anopheles christyi TaxID=43041 RepID=A0A182K322_9DIPT